MLTSFTRPLIQIICVAAFGCPVWADRTLLMVDDANILLRPGTERILNHPTRHSDQPVIAANRPWEQAIGYCSVHRDRKSGKYQLWYQAYTGNRSQDPTRRVVVCYAESDDGLTWIKPSLRHFPFNANRETNIVLVGNGGRSVNYGAAVLFDPRDDDQSRRYKMAYWDFPPPDTTKALRNIPGMYVAFSANGIEWRKQSQLPLLPADYGDAGQPPISDDVSAPNRFPRPAISDVIDLMYDEPRSKFVVYAKTWIDGPDGRRFWKRAVVRSTSKNFVQWTKPELVIAPDSQDTGQLHGAPVFIRHDRYLALLQTLDFGGFDRSGTGNMPGELATSTDGIHWNRRFRNTSFLPVRGDASTFDAGCLWTNAMPIIEGQQFRFYYGAYPSWHADFNAQQTGIGMASIVVDRFAGLRPHNVNARITFHPMRFSGTETLTLNADAKAGSLQAELLDASGFRLAGFTRDDVVAVKKDGTELPVRWKRQQLSDLPNGVYQLRIHLTGSATLFAVTVHKSPR